MSAVIDLTVTALVVAIGLKIAVRLIESIEPELVVLGATVGVVYIAYAITKYRRSQW